MVMNFSKRAWAEINLDSIEYNFKNIKDKLSDKTKLMCVVKADAYGHGVEFLARQYENLGADWFGVSNIDEAIQLRKIGILKPILVFGYTDPTMAKYLYDYNISQSVFSLEYADKLRQECKNKKIKLKIHLKIDTGMSRIGFFSQTDDDIDESVKQILTLRDASEFDIEGIFTHFSVADDVTNNKKYTLNQFDNFKFLISKLEKNGLKIPIKHCCNSGGIVNFPSMHMDMVRAGIILYGLYPSDELSQKISLRPVMQLKTVVSQVKTVPSGISVGYGRTFKSDRCMKIASVSIGYADGYSIHFSNRAYMLLHGKRVKVVGRVCMDQLMLDVSNLGNVQIGDIVTVFGENKGEVISVDELANYAGTINYEIFSLIGKRVSRVYLENNKVKCNSNYLLDKNDKGD